MKATRAVLLIEVEGKLHQVRLDHAKSMKLVEVAAYMCDGELDVYDDPLTSARLEPIA